MPSYRKRPRRIIPPPLAGGGEQSDATHPVARGRGTLRSRQLRATASEAEQKLWHFLRRKQFSGLRFRRQFPLGPYFADFVCLPARLVVEVDGSQHAEPLQAAHDAGRTAWLNRNDFRVVRFWTDQVMTDIESVLNVIESVMREQAAGSPLPHGASRRAPSREGRGE